MKLIYFFSLVIEKKCAFKRLGIQRNSAKRYLLVKGENKIYKIVIMKVHRFTIVATLAVANNVAQMYQRRNNDQCSPYHTRLFNFLLDCSLVVFPRSV